MRIAAISDLHIGARPWMDEFRHHEGDFLRFLDDLEARFEIIVLVGDIFQTDHALVPGRGPAARQFVAARRRLPALAARLASPPYRYVFGNHDAVASDLVGAQESLLLEADGLRVLFVHGHQFDPLFRRVYPLTRAASWFTGRLRFVGLRPLAQHLEAQDIAIKHRRFHHPDGPYLQGGRELLRAHRADIVVMGHTHMPSWTAVPEGWVVNSGTCSLGQRIYVTIDTARRSVEVVV